MAIFRSDRVIGSDLTPERATLGGDGRWRLGWLPEQGLDLDQAMDGLRLDEIVSDPTLVHDRMAVAEATACADRMGILFEQALIRLWKRTLATLTLCGFAALRLRLLVKGHRLMALSG
ncbi:hypothetical protein ACFWU5_20625 [Nocardia sp. NPDC058640]|uniref:hypothetical protein n=1 Tax=Nocardia sp. NPDC058640 TaxID=3346571 RepID=UPI0036697D8E